VTVAGCEGGAGRVELRSNVEVRLEKGVVSKAEFFAKGARNIALTGPGTLDRRGGGGRAVDLSGCKTVRLDGLTILCTPDTSVRVEKCDDVAVDGIDLRNASGTAMKIDFPGCGRVRAANCSFPAVVLD